jgi:hypothetical protein
VVKALGGVQPSPGADALAGGGGDMSVSRLVGSNLLGRDDEIEGNAELAAGGRQQVVIDVG